MKIEQNLQDELAALIADEGLELLATEIVGSGPRTVLRLVIDGPSGVTLDQCSAVSRQASAMLDVADPIRHRYTLEVSSPGIDRKLYSRGDYERFAGHRVKIRMRPSYREHKVVTGELVCLEADTIRLRCGPERLIELPFEEVFEARLEVDWNVIMKEGKSRP